MHHAIEPLPVSGPSQALVIRKGAAPDAEQLCGDPGDDMNVDEQDGRQRGQEAQLEEITDMQVDDVDEVNGIEQDKDKQDEQDEQDEQALPQGGKGMDLGEDDTEDDKEEEHMLKKKRKTQRLVRNATGMGIQNVHVFIRMVTYLLKSGNVQRSQQLEGKGKKPMPDLSSRDSK